MAAASSLLDGGFGFGQTVAPQATALGIERAQQHGTAVIALRNSGHIGRVGDYAEQAIAAGLISIHFVNVAGSVLVAPFGGVERRFSTAPFSVGVPTVAAGGAGLRHLAASPRARCWWRPTAASRCRPTRWSSRTAAFPATRTRSTATTSRSGRAAPPAALGAIRAFGEHKGSGPRLHVRAAGRRADRRRLRRPGRDERGRIANGMLSVFISPKHFGTEAEFIAQRPRTTSPG